MSAVPPAIDALFPSPHFDDVAFSCAGTLAEHLHEGDRTLVVTLFGGAPSMDLPIGPLQRDLLKKDAACAADLHAMWQVRGAEDVAAMALLQTPYRHLDFADAAFRLEIESWRQIFSPPAAASAPLAASLVPTLETLWRNIGRPLVYAPLAVGGHLDHRLCFDAATALERAGADVSYYEDFPDAARPKKLEERLVELGSGWRFRLVDVTRDIRLRATAASCYRSQLPGIFDPMSDAELAQPAGRVMPILLAFARSRSEVPTSASSDCGRGRRDASAAHLLPLLRPSASARRAEAHLCAGRRASSARLRRLRGARPRRLSTDVVRKPHARHRPVGVCAALRALARHRGAARRLWRSHRRHRRTQGHLQQRHLQRLFGARPRGGSRDPYENPNVVAALAVSTHNAEILRFAFPRLPVHVTRPGVDVERFEATPLRNKRRQIAWVGKNPTAMNALRHVLSSRVRQRTSAIAGFRWVQLADLTEAEMIATLKESLIFVFLGIEEGYGILPREAALCGCLTVVFDAGTLDGLGPRGPLVPGDILGAARLIEEVAAAFPGGLDDWQTAVNSAREDVARTSIAAAADEAGAAWTQILAQLPPPDPR